MRYDSIDVSKSDRQTDGQLSARPLAELIREIIDTHLSGAIRVSHGPGKVVVYFDKGKLLFATSNLRAHRLREVLQRNFEPIRNMDQFPAHLSDEELGAALIAKGAITAAVLQQMRSAQTTDVLRVALLWTDGYWSYDRRVRLAGDLGVSCDLDKLLLECGRRLPLDFIRTRVDVGAESYFVTKVDELQLTPTETLTLARVAEANQIRFAELTGKGLREHDALRSIYALCLAGLVTWTGQQTIFSDEPKARPAIEVAKEKKPPAVAPTPEPEAELKILFARLNSAKTHYDVLDVSRAADLTEIKNAYHDLARRFHPDRFHQSELRGQVESAFARIGRAYETLSDPKRRGDYDKTVSAKRPAKATEPAPQPAKARQKPAESQRAETSFDLGAAALQRNQIEDAIRYLAEAAMLEPRVARYRAYYGSALMRLPNSRRTAETELQAALKLEPDNATFRVMLAELYQQVGLRKRAEHEAARALTSDPLNKSARAILSNLTTK